MDALGVLDRLAELGVTIRADGENVIICPASRVPPEVKAGIREHKPGILARLRPAGDGQPPPLGRPPKTEKELRRWMDHTADPEVFVRWLEWAMNYTDPVEDSPCPEDTPSG